MAPLRSRGRPISSLDWRRGTGEPEPDLILTGARVLDPRAGIDAGHDVVVRGGEIAELTAPGSAGGDDAELIDATGLCVLPAFFDPHVHLRTPGREDEEDLETGSRAAAAGGFCGIVAMANTEPPVDTAADVASLREQAREQAAVPIGFFACVTRGMAGAELTEMAELAETGAVGFSDDGLPIRKRPGAAPGASVPAPRRAADRPARGGPRALGRRLDARGGRLGRARDRRHPLDLGVDDDRPRRRDRRLRGRADPRPAPLGGRVGRRGRGGEGGRGRAHLRGDARTT